MGYAGSEQLEVLVALLACEAKIAAFVIASLAVNVICDWVASGRKRKK